MSRVLCVFAHPDDEAFGPGGTLAVWAQQGAEIHLICATKGEAGGEAAVREEELERSAKILGIKTVEYLTYHDGEIGNKDLEMLEHDIVQQIKTKRPDIVLTFNLDGVSGHLDHIAVASATTQAFRKTQIAEKLYYFTNQHAASDLMTADGYFIYFPPGKTREEVDEIINIESVWKTKLHAMQEHRSQQHDVDWIVKILEKIPKEEWFLIRTKEEKKGM